MGCSSGSLRALEGGEARWLCLQCRRRDNRKSGRGQPRGRMLRSTVSGAGLQHLRLPSAPHNAAAAVAALASRLQPQQDPPPLLPANLPSGKHADWSGAAEGVYLPPPGVNLAPPKESSSRRSASTWRRRRRRLPPDASPPPAYPTPLLFCPVHQSRADRLACGLHLLQH